MTFETPTEASLAELWQEILRSDQIGRQREFFSLGGTSMQATRLIVRVQHTFRVELPLSALADVLTIEKMAALIDELTAVAPRPSAEDREQGEI